MPDDVLEFSVTMWILPKQNPNWSQADSTVRFPPLNAKGAMIFLTKYKEILAAYVLHPAFGTRKLAANGSAYYGKKTFVAVTSSANESKLYLNAQLEATATSCLKLIELAVGDVVMVTPSAAVEESGIDSLIPAFIEEIDRERVTVFCVGPNRRESIARSRIYLPQSATAD